MGANNCCEKPQNEDDILNEIFKESPEDNKVPNDDAFFGNYGGEYPQDNGKPARFKYEARYPSSRVNHPSSSNLNIATGPQTYFPNTNKNNLENDLDPNSPDYIINLIIRCEVNGPAKPCDDFKANAWKKYYPIDDKFFNWKKGEKIKENQTKVFNEHDMANVEIYKGDLNEDNQKHGVGKVITPDYVRVGTWRNDKFTGWGRESRRNGEVLEGKFVNGLLNGKGIYLNSKGGKYLGDFVDSRKHGKGELTTTKIHYVGEFVNNKMDGKGKIEFLIDGHEYEGQFHANAISGNGRFKWINGDVYEGEMMNGKMNGYGKYIYHDGTIYEGRYVNGVKDGHGKITFTNGKIMEGDFLGGVPMKEDVSVMGMKVPTIGADSYLAF